MDEICPKKQRITGDHLRHWCKVRKGNCSLTPFLVGKRILPILLRAFGVHIGGFPTFENRLCSQHFTSSDSQWQVSF